MWRPRYSQSFVSTKGLLNAPGENNCFLNSAIQVLWHLDVFRRSFRLLSGHVCMDNSCIFCGLKVLFTQFQYSDQTSLPPDAMRKALAQTFADQQRFQMGLMDDAAECLENILMRIHSHIAHLESEDMCSAPHCIPHRKFAMTVVEQVVCRCGATSEPLPFTQMVHYVSTRTLVQEWRYMIDHSRESQTDIFDQLLRTANARNDLRDCPSNCGQKVEIRRNLMNKPDVVCVGLVWDSDRPAPSHIMDVLRCIGTNLRLCNVFHSAADAGQSKPLSLVGVVCYYGKHYSTFFYNSRLRRWIYFDDATVKEMGSDWASVADKCCRGHYQPLLLLYANHEADVINADTAPQFTTRIASQMMPHSKQEHGTTASSASHGQQMSQFPTQSTEGATGSSQRRAITPGPIQFDRNPADIYEVAARRAVTPGPDKNIPSSRNDGGDMTSSSQYHSDEQLNDKKRAAAVHVRQSSYMMAVDFLSPTLPGGASSHHQSHDIPVNYHKCEPDEGYYTQRPDQSRKHAAGGQYYTSDRGQDRMHENNATTMHNKNTYSGVDTVDGSQFTRDNYSAYPNHSKVGYAEYTNSSSREGGVTNSETVVQNNEGSRTVDAAGSKDTKSLPPHKSRLAKAAAIQRKESFKRGNKIPADVIRFDVSEVPTPLAGTNKSTNNSQQATVGKSGPVEVCQEAMDWQYGRQQSKPDGATVMSSQLPRSQSNYALDTATRKPRRERRHTLHSNPSDEFDLDKNNTQQWHVDTTPATNYSQHEQNVHPATDYRKNGPPPYEDLPISRMKASRSVQHIHHAAMNPEPECPPPGHHMVKVQDPYMGLGTRQAVSHKQQASTDSTHNASQNRKAMEHLYQHYQQRGLAVKKPHKSREAAENGRHLQHHHHHAQHHAQRHAQQQPGHLYVREASVTDSDYNSGDRNSSSSNNSLPPLETKESRMAKQAAERLKLPPSYDQSLMAGVSKTTTAAMHHHTDKFSSSSESLSSSQSAHSRTSTLKNDPPAFPPGLEADMHELCSKAESLMAESLKKEEEADLAAAMCLCTQAVTYLKQAIQLDTCSYESHVYARMKHNTCVLRSRSLHRRIMMRQESNNTTASEASDNVSESSLQTNDSGLPEYDSHPSYGVKSSKSMTAVHELSSQYHHGNPPLTVAHVREASLDQTAEPVSNLIKSWNNKITVPTVSREVTTSAKPVYAAAKHKPYAQVYVGGTDGTRVMPAENRQEAEYKPPQGTSAAVTGFNASSKYGDFSIKFVDYNGRPVSNDAVASGHYNRANSMEPQSTTTTTSTVQQSGIVRATHQPPMVGQKATIHVTNRRDNIADTDKRSLEIFGTLPRGRSRHSKQMSSDRQQDAPTTGSSTRHSQHARERSQDKTLQPNVTAGGRHQRERSQDNTLLQQYQREGSQDNTLHAHHRRDRSSDSTLKATEAIYRTNKSIDTVDSRTAQHRRSGSRDNTFGVVESSHRRERSRDNTIYGHIEKHSRESSSDSTLQGSHHSRQSSNSSHTSQTSTTSSKQTARTSSYTAPTAAKPAVYSSSQTQSAYNQNNTYTHHNNTTSAYPSYTPASLYQQQGAVPSSSSDRLSSQVAPPCVEYVYKPAEKPTLPVKPFYTTDQQRTTTQHQPACTAYPTYPSHTLTGFVSEPSATYDVDDQLPPPPPPEQLQQMLMQDQMMTSSVANQQQAHNYQSASNPSTNQMSRAPCTGRGPKPAPPVRVSSIPAGEEQDATPASGQYPQQSGQSAVSDVRSQIQRLELQQMQQLPGNKTGPYDQRSGYSAAPNSYIRSNGKQAYTGYHPTNPAANGQLSHYPSKEQHGADLSSNNSKSFRTVEGQGSYPVTGSSVSAGPQVAAVYLGGAAASAHPNTSSSSTSRLPTSSLTNQSSLPSSRKATRSAGSLPGGVKPLGKSVKFCDQVVLVGAMDDMPQEQDYMSLVHNLLNRRGKPLQNSPMPARKNRGTAAKDDAAVPNYMCDSDNDENNSDTGSSTGDSADAIGDNDKVRCNLCRKKHIAMTEMYCEACRHYLARLGQATVS